MNGVEKRIREIQWWRHVVGDSAGGMELGGTVFAFPRSDELHEDWGTIQSAMARLGAEQRGGERQHTIVREARIEHLADHEDIGRKSALEHDGHLQLNQPRYPPGDSTLLWSVRLRYRRVEPDKSLACLAGDLT